MNELRKLGLSHLSEKEAFEMDIESLVIQYNWQENVDPISDDFVQRWRAYRKANGNPKALIYKIARERYGKRIDLIDYTFPPSKKIRVYEKAEKIKTQYFEQGTDKIFVQKSRSYEYNEQLTPTQMLVKTEYFDDNGLIVYTTEKRIVFTDSNERTERRFKRLDRLFREGITFLANSGISDEQLGYLNILLANEIILYKEGAINFFIEKINSEELVANTQFLTQNQRETLTQMLSL